MANADLPILLVRSGGPAAVPGWQAAFADILPQIEVRGWDDPSVDPARVRYVLVWQPEPGRLATYPNLDLIFSTAAGIDHITADAARPMHVPVVRMGADEMAQSVGEYVCLAALMILRDLPRIISTQRAAAWDRFEVGRTARATQVGILGMGKIGQAAARMLQGIGFAVQGWTRTPRVIDGVPCCDGPDALPAFLAASDILVGILPDTPETRGLLNAERLAMLPAGAGIVSVGRGSLIVMPDLLAALDRGHLSLAVLDVFETEPLPADDPAWRHARVVVSSHLAGVASKRSRVEWVAHCLAEHAAGRMVPNVYEPGRGY